VPQPKNQNQLPQKMTKIKFCRQPANFNLKRNTSRWLWVADFHKIQRKIAWANWQIGATRGAIWQLGAPNDFSRR
jgi:hypothetical protein